MNVHRISAVLTAFLFSVFGSAGAALAQGQPAVGEPHSWQLGLQASASPVKEQLTDFHNLLLVVITGITLLVLALLIYVMVRFNAKANPNPTRTSHNTILEVAWTVLPVVILVVIAVPSFKVLYFMDKAENAEMTLKVIGHQWFWEYQYPDHEDLTFSSYMIPDDEIQPGQRRLLEVDNRIVLPVDTNIRIIVTAGDVLHSWAMPSLGIKKDAIPGRLNETWARIDREGVYYGQCSEICGTNHGYMPIAIEAVSKERFAQWLVEAKEEFASNAPKAPAVQVAQAPAAPVPAVQE
ncbi:cytochrome c oxidase subunit II [Skermanella sp. TT6]|uniref:Cytochrome c oxidase subunit 2 n=1 Tax=Skermanella cutis TaxID=2775420 RepID=A0ABX7B6T0_9PROT|nr:cytochrome c oxidase subunit II [Skermanella sp. TT6]QQP90069.1 cytochrome c oxidase subunit II [Skermanella sp. TT6]